MKFEAGRPLSPERIASRYNNFYELTTDKESVWTLVDSYPKRPWAVSVDGLCKKPKTWDNYDEEV